MTMAATGTLRILVGLLCVALSAGARAQDS
jgi:hypothetical protein